MKHHFPPIIATVLLSCATALPAAADACRDEIAALYDGGALDAFARPPHRQTVLQYGPDGNLTRTGSVIVETPLRTIGGEEAASHFSMVVDREMWNGPTTDGPWTNLGFQMPEGMEESVRRGMAQEQKNLADTICHGETGDGLIHYTYRTQLDPDEKGIFYGALTELYLDPVIGWPVRMEQTEFINSWSEGISEGRNVILFEYDATIRVTPPK